MLLIKVKWKPSLLLKTSIKAENGISVHNLIFWEGGFYDFLTYVIAPFCTVGLVWDGIKKPQGGTQIIIITVSIDPFCPRWKLIFQSCGLRKEKFNDWRSYKKRSKAGGWSPTFDSYNMDHNDIVLKILRKRDGGTISMWIEVIFIYEPDFHVQQWRQSGVGEEVIFIGTHAVKRTSWQKTRHDWKPSFLWKSRQEFGLKHLFILKRHFYSMGLSREQEQKDVECPFFVGRWQILRKVLLYMIDTAVLYEWITSQLERIPGNFLTLKMTFAWLWNWSSSEFPCEWTQSNLERILFEGSKAMEPWSRGVCLPWYESLLAS